MINRWLIKLGQDLLPGVCISTWRTVATTAALSIFYMRKSPYGKGCYQILEGGWRSWRQLIMQWDTFFKYYPEHCFPNVLIKVEDEDAKPALVRQITEHWFVERGSCFCQTNWSHRTFVLFFLLCPIFNLYLSWIALASLNRSWKSPF